MKYFFYFIGIIFLLSINYGVFSLLPVFRQVPNLLLLAVIVFALEKENLDFFFVALLAGLFVDVSAGLFLGSYTFFFLILAFVLHLVIKYLIVDDLNWKQLAVIVVLVSYLNLAFIYFYNWLFLRWGVISAGLNKQILGWNALAYVGYNLVLFFPLYWLIERLFAWFAKTGVSKYQA